MGIVGLALFLFMCARLAQSAYRIHRRAETRDLRLFALGFLAIMGHFIGSGFFAQVWEWRPTSLYFWLIAAMLLKWAREDGGMAAFYESRKEAQ